MKPRRTIKIQLCSAIVAAMLLVGCERAEHPVSQSDRMVTSATTRGSILASDVPPAPPPEHLPTLRQVDGEKALVVKADPYSVALHKEDSHLVVQLSKAAALDETGFESTVTTGPTEYRTRLMNELEQHPELRSLLVSVLNAASDAPHEELQLTDQDRAEIDKLLSVTKEPMPMDVEVSVFEEPSL